MKSIFSSRRNLSVVLLAAAFSLILTSCKKGLDNNNNIPASGLMVLNLAPDQNALGIALSGNLLTHYPVAYTGFNGQYQNIYAGQREVAVFDYPTDSVIAKATQDFADGELYSLFVTGNKGVYTPIVVHDEVDSSATADKAYIRFINAIADSSSPVVSISAGGSKVIDQAAAFNTVSPFTAVSEGNVDVSVSGNNITASRTLQLQKGNVYTALIIGDPAATDSIRKVQIRYIQNGSVPASTQK